MNAITFDTLSYFEKLNVAGFTAGVARLNR